MISFFNIVAIELQGQLQKAYFFHIDLVIRCTFLNSIMWFGFNIFKITNNYDFWHFLIIIQNDPKLDLGANFHFDIYSETHSFILKWNGEGFNLNEIYNRWKKNIAFICLIIFS